jgi:hypothetical protein
MPLWKLIIWAAVIGAILVPAAAAAGPTVTITPFDRTRTIAAGPDACPFPIVVHSTGTFREALYSDGTDKTTVREFHITWTNPASGKSITSVLGGPEIVEPNGDGTVTVTINGNDAHFNAPGYGSIFADVGHFVYLAAADDPTLTPIAVVKATGHQDASLFPAVCAPLA